MVGRKRKLDVFLNHQHRQHTRRSKTFYRKLILNTLCSVSTHRLSLFICTYPNEFNYVSATCIHSAGLHPQEWIDELLCLTPPLILSRYMYELFGEKPNVNGLLGLANEELKSRILDTIVSRTSGKLHTIVAQMLASQPIELSHMANILLRSSWCIRSHFHSEFQLELYGQLSLYNRNIDRMSDMRQTNDQVLVIAQELSVRIPVVAKWCIGTWFESHVVGYFKVSQIHKQSVRGILSCKSNATLQELAVFKHLEGIPRGVNSRFRYSAQEVLVLERTRESKRLLLTMVIAEASVRGGLTLDISWFYIISTLYMCLRFRVSRLSISTIASYLV
jgi:hypothetical protein